MTQPKKTFTITRTITQTAEIEAYNTDDILLIMELAPGGFAWQDHHGLDTVEITEKPQKG